MLPYLDTHIRGAIGRRARGSPGEPTPQGETRVKEQLAELEDREDRLYDDLSGGVLDDVANRRQLQRLRDQRARCTEQLEAANEELDRTYLADAQKIFGTRRAARNPVAIAIGCGTAEVPRRRATETSCMSG